MTTAIVPVPYAPQKLVDGNVKGGKNLSFKIDVPADAVPGGVGTISVGSLGGAQFNAVTNLASAPDVFGDAPYTRVDGTFSYQVEPTTPDKPGEQPKYHVAPGGVIHVNITVAHDGKTGSDEVKTARCECRAAQ